MRIRWSKQGAALYDFDAGSNTKAVRANSDALKLDGDLATTDTVTFQSWGMVNLPASLALSKIIYKCNNFGGELTVKVSNDSVTGLDGDGTWTTVVDAVSYTGPATATFSFDAVNCKWVRWKNSSGNVTYGLHLFGAYTSNSYEFWAANGSAQLVGDYPLAFAAATNGADSNQTLQFKIKNTDSAAHSYYLAPEAFRYNGDPMLDTELTISLDGGTTKSASVTTASVAADALSELITVCLDVPAATNPADGPHSFTVAAVAAS